MEEMQAIKKNNTWDAVHRPKDKVPVGCKWVFSVKYKVDGSIEQYNARLVAKGYIKPMTLISRNIDPVAKININRVLLPLAANLDRPLTQMDVKNAFLNGDLEEVYIDSPLGFDQESKIGKACKLQESLYRLKQSPQAWFGQFTKALHNKERNKRLVGKLIYLAHTRPDIAFSTSCVS